MVHVVMWLDLTGVQDTITAHPKQSCTAISRDYFGEQHLANPRFLFFVGFFFFFFFLTLSNETSAAIAQTSPVLVWIQCSLSRTL